MKYLKQMCCFLIVVLVIVTGFCATVSSVARAEETSAPADPPQSQQVQSSPTVIWHLWRLRLQQQALVSVP